MRGVRMLLLVVLIVCDVGLRVRADDAAVAPFVDDQTLVIVRLDLIQLDSQKILNWGLSKVAEKGTDAATIDLIRSMWTARIHRSVEFQSAMRNAGAKRMYCVLSVADFADARSIGRLWNQNGWFGRWVVPLEPNADADVIGNLLRGGANLNGQTAPAQVERAENAVVVTRTSDAAHFEKASLSGDWAAALKSDAAIVIASVPGKTFRQSFEENLPTVGLSTPITQFTRGITWASVSIAMPPNASVAGIAQCTDAEAARTAAASVNALAGQIEGNYVPLISPVQPLQDAAHVLTCEAEGSTIRWSPNFNSLLLPQMIAQLQNAPAERTRGNMQQLLLASIMYANTHKAFPPDVATLMKEQEMSPGVLQDLQHPQEANGFVYIKPPTAATDPKTPVLYEKWEGGLLVGFADGHVETLESRAAVMKLFAGSRP
jgi:hypothetical protein